MKIDNAVVRQYQDQVANANQKAFEGLYRLFFARLFNFSVLYVSKKEVAEEIVNDVMIKIWKNRDTLGAILDLETYLFVSVRNASLNYLSQYSRYQVVLEPDSDRAEMVTPEDPERALEWKEIYFHLNKAIDELPEQCRTVFRLIKEEGFRYKQVAEILNISPRTVETQLYRAIKKLDKVLETWLEDPHRGRSRKLPLISLLVFMLPAFI
ncbi:MAG: RNA polymerase sigma-70 factor [Bacteroidetes bacterium]|nr:RNA polymerase sigma-70 factor [Bacteroidota bacterium]